MRELVRARGAELRARYGAHSIGVGRKVVDGRRTDELAVIFYVEDAGRLRRADPGDDPVHAGRPRRTGRAGHRSGRDATNRPRRLTGAARTVRRMEDAVRIATVDDRDAVVATVVTAFERDPGAAVLLP